MILGMAQYTVYHVHLLTRFNLYNLFAMYSGMVEHEAVITVIVSRTMFQNNHQ